MADDRAAFTQRIKEANDIVDVVGRVVNLRQVGRIYIGLCPFHDDSRPSLRVDPDPKWQNYRCWACGKHGDVFTFVQETQRVSFPEALELLARQAGISLENVKLSPHNPGRALMLDVMRWASEQFQACLLESPTAEAARVYLGERRLTGETVRKFGLGFAPPQGEWLVQKAVLAKHPLNLLEQVGLIAKRNEGTGYYDRFRDRVMFPIRDLRGQTVGFGGRILPTSPLLKKEQPPPKYYNSAETMLFSKSRELYGIDHARDAAIKAGCLAIVEGYTDVLMAHQMGIANVVATMGTALNDRHIEQLRRVVAKVILVFDADAGGETGVDRAIEVFVKNDLELQVATLPAGLDPCDLLVQQGPEPFQSALTKAVNVLESKLHRVWEKEARSGVEGQRRAVDAVLGILALAPETRTIKLELMINRIAHRLGLKEETVWARLDQVRAARRGTDRPPREPEPQEQTSGAPNYEVELLEALLADPSLVSAAQAEVQADEVEHPGLRLLVEGLYRLHAEGVTPSLDHLRARIDDRPRLLHKALELQGRGLEKSPRLPTLLEEVLGRFREKRARLAKQELSSQLQGVNDHDAAVALLRKLQK